MEEILQQTIEYIATINPFEAIGLFFGLLSVVFLIRENIWTWPTGIIYVLASIIIFWNEKLYADFGLHIFFLALNIYGWWYWIGGSKKKRPSPEGMDGASNVDPKTEVPISTTKKRLLIQITLLSIAGTFITGFLLNEYTDASLPYWDSATTIFSVTGIWLTAKKKIENWYFWFFVDTLATLVYFYKDIYFYSILYLIYIGLAVAGYVEWRKKIQLQKTA